MIFKEITIMGFRSISGSIFASNLYKKDLRYIFSSPFSLLYNVDWAYRNIYIYLYIYNTYYSICYSDMKYKNSLFFIPSNYIFYAPIIKNLFTRNTVQCDVRAIRNHPITSLYLYFTCCLY